jgi:hypothetical protein
MKNNKNIEVLSSIIQNKIKIENNLYGTTMLKVTAQDGDVLSLANEIYESGMVEYSHPDFIANIAPSDDPYYSNQYYLNNSGQFNGTSGIDINAPQAWDLTTSSSQITVAVIDEGLEPHEDLNDINNNSRVLTGFTPHTGGDGTPEGLISFHGIACAGIIAASHNNLDIKGIAPNVKLFGINIFSDGTTNQEIADGINWAWHHGADVISCSWGYTVPGYYADVVEYAIDSAKTFGRSGKGCVVVFSSGNDNFVQFPSNVNGVICTSAIDNSGNLWYYSPTSSRVDLVAPSGDVNMGGDVWTLDRMGNNGYQTYNYITKFGGTSASCPQVSGVAALLLSLHPDWSETQITTTLKMSATDMGAIGKDDTFGYGRLDTYKAVSTIYVPDVLSTIEAALSTAFSGQTVKVLSSVNVSNNITVGSGIKLYIDPNVTLTFGSGKRIYVSGTLSTNSATFQGNGSAGYWNSITLLSGSSASILNTTIKDAQCGIYANQASGLTITSSIIENNSLYGISITSTNPAISNCTIQNNGTGIRSYSSRPEITGCTIQNNTNYGINADNISYYYPHLYWANNNLQGNGYAILLNNASPRFHDNMIAENSHGIFMTSSYTNFADPSNSWRGYNAITCSVTPLFRAENYSSIYAGYGYDGGYNSIFGSELPDMEAYNNSMIYACNNYWGSPYPAILADGTSTILAWYPLSTDPNPGSCTLSKTSSLAKSSALFDESELSKIYLEAISIGQKNDFSTAKELLKSIIEDKFDNKYTPLALLAYIDFEAKEKDLSGSEGTYVSDDILKTIYNRDKEDQLRPFATRLLARETALVSSYDEMISYNTEIINNYPNSANEISALYDLVNYYSEIKEDNVTANKYLERMNEIYPKDDLTLFANINLALYSKNLEKDKKINNEQTPKEYSLGDNYPNPFNPTTTIGYSIPTDEKVVLKVYDILGKEVAILVNEQKPEGNYQVIFNAENLASGLYLYQIKSGTFIQTKKMILMK